MMLRKWILPLVFICFLLCLGIVHAQSPSTTGDTTSQSQVEKPSPNEGEELVLDTIEITGRIEKPGMIIMPKRVEPDLEKMELGRSFDKELKEGIGEIPKPENALKQVDRIKSIKKTVERKRK